MPKSRFIAAPVAGRLMAMAAVIALWGAVFLSPPAQAQQPSFADLAEGLIDAVVNISTSQTVSGQRSVPMPDLPEGSPFQEFFKEFFDRNQSQPRARRVSSLGSGFVIDPSGVIVTNAHVIEDADEIEVKFNDGTVLKATVRGRDSKTDLAVLEVTPEPGMTLTSAPLGSSDALRVGDWVMAIGNPFGLGGTVTVGIVSARNRDINAGPYDDFIQTDAAINRGNSGGPLFDINGNVIGINTAIISPSGGSIGIGFAVPTETARPVIAQLREFGETRRGWLGVRIQPVTEEIAESLDLADTSGALVSGVNPDGPAAGAGIVSGDVILEFDGKVIAEMSKLPRVVADTEIGKEVVVSLWRKGERIDLDVTVARLDEDDKKEEAAEPESGDEAEPQLSEVLGLTLSTITDELRSKLELADDAQGIVVISIDETSVAYDKGLREGDLIIEAEQKAIDTPDQFKDVVSESQQDGKPSVLLLIQRGKDDPPVFLGLPLKS